MRLLQNLVCVTGIALFASVGAAPAQEKQPVGNGIDPATVAAFKKIGGKYGGFLRDNSGSTEFYCFPEAANTRLPGFLFDQVPTDKIPGVQVDFGLIFKSISGDEDLKQLAILDNLATLGLRGTKVTDAGLKELSSLKNLTTLCLDQTKVSDVGLKELARLKNLSWLGLVNTKVTDKGLRELASLKNLCYLELADTPVTDAGLKELSSLTNLVYLGLTGTQVTDVGLKELVGLKQLAWLSLSFTKATKIGVAELKQALPKCTITYLP